MLSPLPETTPTPTSTPTPTPIEQDTPMTKGGDEAIEDYIRTIFGKDARTAIAITHNECSPQHPDYPECVYITKHEYSVGLWQINIQSRSAKVHFDRIPGDTLEQKIEWLKDPYNNTLMAYWIFSNSYWYPWRAYTSGNYLNDL